MVKITDKEQKELWIRFCCAALQGFEAQVEPEDHDEHAEDMILVASKVADGMMDEYKERFAGGRPRKRKIESEPPPESESVSKRDPDEDPDDDDLDDDDDDEEATG